jgi:tetratricopeptide (TPR) repeat protein
MTANVSNLDPVIQQRIDQLATDTAGREVSDAIPNPLTPTSYLQSKVEAQIKQQFNRFLKRIQTGLQELYNALNALYEVQNDNAYAEALKHFRSLENPVEIKGKRTPRESYGLSKATMEAFNQAASFLYENKEYEKAVGVYTFLSYLDPNEPAFWLGLGNAEYYCRCYEAALVAYEAAGEANSNDPQYLLFSSHCYDELGQIEKAIKCTDQALALIASKPSLIEWREKTANLKSYYIKKS